MHLTAFQSGKGDCLLLTNDADTTRMLVDGGMPDAYAQHVAPALGQLRDDNKSIDVIYISHIDDDHIGGILHLLNDEMEWRVHEFQTSHGNPSHPAPASPRPPKVKNIWHNAFHEQLADNSAAIEDALAASAPWLLSAGDPKWQYAGEQQAGLATSIQEAIGVSRRISAKQLGITLNAPSNGKLMMLRPSQPTISLGGMTITLLGPAPKHLTKLRKDWNAWLQKNAAALKAIQDAAKKDESSIGNASFAGLQLNITFGNPATVTPPNLASLTMLVEEGAQKILLTGDSRGDQIMDGLKAVGKLTTGGTFKVDVLKVQHHGSENNIDSDFCDAVFADDYVFCGNGENANPNHDVVDLMVKRRLMQPGRFKFWFNSFHTMPKKAAAVTHMKGLEAKVQTLAQNSQGRMTFRFMDSGSSFRVI